MKNMNTEKLIEQLVLVSLDTAKGMLDEYQLVIPFGIRVFSDSDDVKMNCPADQHREADWNEQIDLVVAELRDYVKAENVYATALVTSLEAESEMGIGLQVETEASSALFIYPYSQKEGEWVIAEPIQTEQLLTTVFPVNTIS
ncbi:hypothetical protein MNBD_GAMMA24-792 [hydrothermal vent metagenome]|uniref:Uncharacterized protein n=1 Tax=hydrothermal vent metagenome TaxID=652676 RepID=A0A3B1B770_9ZZZZ